MEATAALLAALVPRDQEDIERRGRRIVVIEARGNMAAGGESGFVSGSASIRDIAIECAACRCRRRPDGQRGTAEGVAQVAR